MARILRSASGSSPHTRGAQMRIERENHQTGIIPAYAGSTGSLANSAGISWDHPRIRGEHGGVVVRAPEFQRIIPAYAGSTDAGNEPIVDIEDHPRIRGEHRLDGSNGRDRVGSSPHTRGARVQMRILRIAGGIIPAYAGSTRGFGVPGAFDRGSSPHTRGARVQVWILQIARGIIPAYAGSTPGTPGRRFRRWDHPRIRGEHRSAASKPSCRWRIIPAYAGSTGDDPPQEWVGWDHPRIRGEHWEAPPERPIR
mgnify:CR=1 FL=1